MKKLLLATILFASAVLVGDGFIKPKTYQAIAKTYGSAASRRLERLESLMQSLKNQNEANKLLKVNSFFNDPTIIKWQDDMTTWGKADYWANRFESLGKGAGDCEDFVIAKFLTLLQLGVSENKLYFTYVYANIRGKKVAHMVLSYYENPNDVPFILDSLTTSIKRANKRTDLTPVMTFNARELLLAKGASMGRMSVNSSKYTAQWGKYLNKLKEGDL